MTNAPVPNHEFGNKAMDGASGVARDLRFKELVRRVANFGYNPPFSHRGAPYQSPYAPTLRPGQQFVSPPPSPKGSDAALLALLQNPPSISEILIPRIIVTEYSKTSQPSSQSPVTTHSPLHMHEQNQENLVDEEMESADITFSLAFRPKSKNKEDTSNKPGRGW